MILLTGGAGYIGSHICLALLDAGFEVVVVDNLSNSSRISLERVQSISGRAITFYQADIRDEESVFRILVDCRVSAVIHLAALKMPAESLRAPETYFNNNVVGTMKLVSAMKRANVRKLVFSSSASVYGSPVYLPLDERHPCTPVHPYGQGKLSVENILSDLCRSDGEWQIGILRYFNPVGAHQSGLIGEDPLGPPQNLVPLLAHVAIGRQKSLTIWGDDYDTPDGTGIRDYVHILDLASGHLDMLNHLGRGCPMILNLGTGAGSSVLEVIRTFENITGRTIPRVIGERRPGDIAICYADPTLAFQTMGWRSTRSLTEMCADHWRWQQQNPEGFIRT
jgi:UDP-glucose 4-epimerase